MFVYKIFTLLSRIFYYLTLPILRLYIKNSSRAYVVIRDDKKILFIKNCFGDGQWSLPGGGIRAGETPEQAILREVKEEVGYSLNVDKLNFIKKDIKKKHKLGYEYYIYSAKHKAEPVNLRWYEICDYRWVNIENLADIVIDSDVSTVLADICR